MSQTHSDTDSQTCPECRGTVRTAGTEDICTDCGLVVDKDTLDRGPEWRWFAEDDRNRKRTGAPLTHSRHDHGLSTEIGRLTRIKGRKRRRLVRMRREHTRAQVGSKRDRNKIYAFTEIRRIIGVLSLPRTIRDQSCMLFTSAQNEGLLPGRSLEGFAAAAVYTICRTNTISRTVAEVVDAARATEEELHAAYNAMNRHLGLPTGPVDPREYLPRFASELNVPPGVERTACEYLATVEDANRVAGKNPAGIAAGCLYAAAQDHGHGLTQADAADVAAVTPPTLRSTVSVLRND